MRVRAKSGVHVDLDDHNHQGLTPGNEYDVIAIVYDEFRIAGDNKDPVLYPQYLFEVVDAAMPDYWVHQLREDWRYHGPAEFAVPGFWERYHDHEPEAMELYRRIMRQHGFDV